MSETGSEVTDEQREQLDEQILGICTNLKKAFDEGAGLSLETQVNLAPEDVAMIVSPEHKLLPALTARVVSTNWQDHVRLFLEAVALRLHESDD